VKRAWAWLAAAALGLLALWTIPGGWYANGPLPRATPFIVAKGMTLGAITPRLAQAGAIGSPGLFRLRARLLGGGGRLKAGEYLLPAHASEATIVAILSGNQTVQQFITIPEGMPAIMVAERLAAQPQLTGPAPLPAEGSVLPQTYDFRPGEARSAVLARMQAAMAKALAAAWEARAPGLPLATPDEALTLAAIVEKETGKPSERATVAGLYENRLRQGIMLQADPTIIYPITHGRALGRRIRQSEIMAHNGWNTYTMAGLPRGPITNPGEASILAVLHPAKTAALYMVADGTGGHVFASSLEEHNRNVAKWFAIRRARGDL